MRCNSVAESFFATVKTELIYRHTWPSRRVAKSAAFKFIAGWSNQHLRHSTLGYLSPPLSNGAPLQSPPLPNQTLHETGASPYGEQRQTAWPHRQRRPPLPWIAAPLGPSPMTEHRRRLHESL